MKTLQDEEKPLTLKDRFDKGRQELQEKPLTLKERFAKGKEEIEKRELQEKQAAEMAEREKSLKESTPAKKSEEPKASEKPSVPSDKDRKYPLPQRKPDEELKDNIESGMPPTQQPAPATMPQPAPQPAPQPTLPTPTLPAPQPTLPTPTLPTPTLPTPQPTPQSTLPVPQPKPAQAANEKQTTELMSEMNIPPNWSALLETADNKEKIGINNAKDLWDKSDPVVRNAIRQILEITDQTPDNVIQNAINVLETKKIYWKDLFKEKEKKPARLGHFF